ncbi:14271_t:CDS:1 [Entrophospora sp. SA101]|nr:538_t:CDS:1 [Entrophospora sp. SA101]CAJ0641670.1 14271_t:CDS:1 [Entrophospora sp. SA101]CAJ0823598.1 6666_t:CDS:1 [Entrophospora sp. SA101]CAJ0833746.1 6210_t:CDS:1 [Entrophospora sp. SA101]CAJ0838688.1 9005_t:CDS:1 [Entrophospora sp. SA101]
MKRHLQTTKSNSEDGGRCHIPVIHNNTEHDCIEPSVLFQQPSVLFRQQSVLHRQPSNLHRQPSILHRQPSVLHRQPSVLHRQPSILHRQLSDTINGQNKHYHERTNQTNQ